MLQYWVGWGNGLTLIRRCFMHDEPFCLQEFNYVFIEVARHNCISRSCLETFDASTSLGMACEISTLIAQCPAAIKAHSLVPMMQGLDVWGATRAHSDQPHASTCRLAKNQVLLYKAATFLLHISVRRPAGGKLATYIYYSSKGSGSGINIPSSIKQKLKNKVAEYGCWAVQPKLPALFILIKSKTKHPSQGKG